MTNDLELFDLFCYKMQGTLPSPELESFNKTMSMFRIEIEAKRKTYVSSLKEVLALVHKELKRRAELN